MRMTHVSRHRWIIIAGGLVLMLVTLVAFIRSTRIRDEHLPICRGILVRAPSTDSSFSILYETAADHLRAGRIAEADALYRRIIEGSPTDPDAHAALAACLIFQDDVSGAQRELQSALELDPSSTHALHGLGVVAYDQGFLAEAVEYYKRALAIDPAQPSTQWACAIACDALGDSPATLVHYREFVALAPGDPDADYARRRIADLSR